MAESIWFVPTAEPSLLVYRPIFIAVLCEVVSRSPLVIDELLIYPPSRACCFKTRPEAEEELFMIWEECHPRISRQLLRQSSLEEYRRFVLSVCPEQRSTLVPAKQQQSEWFTLYDMMFPNEIPFTIL